MSRSYNAHKTIVAVTERIAERSAESRAAYLAEMASRRVLDGVRRAKLNITCVAHGQAAAPGIDKKNLMTGTAPNIGIITSFNDMLSAHQPYEKYPDIIKAAARERGATAQVAGGVAAMCDGITQGEEGGYLSLPSRDFIAQATGIGLSHDMYDAALYLGICDKIVPGLLIGALTYGHIPGVFVPAGPMTSGISNIEKKKIRQLFDEGKATREELVASEGKSYHSPGTCTFYGTANSNQMLMEIMGLHVPGSSFVNPETQLREALTAEATHRAISMWSGGNEYTPICDIIDERAVVNGIVGLHATGGSTNHTLHLIAIAAAAGIKINWQDMAELSDAVPLLSRVYPNGDKDVNHFRAAGGMGFMIGELLKEGLLHEDVKTVNGTGLSAYVGDKVLDEGKLHFIPAPSEVLDDTVLRPISNPFLKEGGLKVLGANVPAGIVEAFEVSLGEAVMKVSAVKPENQNIHARVRIFSTQKDFMDTIKNTPDMVEEIKKEGGMIAVIRFNSANANGMPELHKLVERLSSLQKQGARVGLVTDGRLSGASGDVPAAIHLTPNAVDGGPIARLRDGDIVRISPAHGEIRFFGDVEEFMARPPATLDVAARNKQLGPARPLMNTFLQGVNPSNQGACSLDLNYGN